MFFQALFLQLGYNATLVALGATLLGAACGITGTFLFLRKRALVSDAVSHATLPGICLAFLLMVGLGGEGRNLAGLMAGSAVSAGIGLWCMNWLTRNTRLAEDAAIGSVLSVFFGFGVVLMTVIQSLGVGRQAGLEGFLLGSTAGMLYEDALVIAIGGAVVLGLVLLLQRPMTLVGFDPEYAQARGLNVAWIDLAMMGLVMAVTVIGLKIVGLILIVALLIIPPVTARFWSERASRVAVLAGGFGAVSAYLGAVLSAVAPNVPTGPVIVLVSFSLFVLSLFFAPERGAIARVLRRRMVFDRVQTRQGLSLLAAGTSAFDRQMQRLLQRRGYVSADGQPTLLGRAHAQAVAQDDARWQALRLEAGQEMLAGLYDGVSTIDCVLTPDQITQLDLKLSTSASALHIAEVRS